MHHGALDGLRLEIDGALGGWQPYSTVKVGIIRGGGGESDCPKRYGCGIGGCIYRGLVSGRTAAAADAAEAVEFGELRSGAKRYSIEVFDLGDDVR